MSDPESWFEGGAPEVPEALRVLLEKVNNRFTELIEESLTQSNSPIDPDTGKQSRQAAVYSDALGAVVDLDDRCFEENPPPDYTYPRSAELYKSWRNGGEFEMSVRERMAAVGGRAQWEVDAQGVNPQPHRNLIGQPDIGGDFTDIASVLLSPDVEVIIHAQAFPRRPLS